MQGVCCQRCPACKQAVQVAAWGQGQGGGAGLRACSGACTQGEIDEIKAELAMLKSSVKTQSVA